LWPTPTAADAYTGRETYARGNPSLSGAVRWPTPRTSDAERGGRGDLIQAVSGNENGHFRMWPTPLARDANTLAKCRRGADSEGGEPLTVAVGGTLNPEWVEWLMNWPIGWTALETLDGREVEYWKTASAANVSGGLLREMWFNREAGAPSPGPGSDEQLTRKHHGHVFLLPPPGSHEDSARDVLGVRAWISAEEEQEGDTLRLFRMQQGARPEIRRVAVGVRHRVDRGRALGNGQVPSVAALAWEMLR